MRSMIATPMRHSIIRIKARLLSWLLDRLRVHKSVSQDRLFRLQLIRDCDALHALPLTVSKRILTETC